MRKLFKLMWDKHLKNLQRVESNKRFAKIMSVSNSILEGEKLCR